MMGKRLSRILVLTTVCALVFACGEYDEMETRNDQTGSIGFQVTWRGAPSLADDMVPNARALNCAASEIESVTFDVVDANDNLLATDSWSCAQHQGIVDGVPAGAGRKLIVEGTDTQDRVRYRGEVAGITVVAGQHEDVDTVVCDPVEYIDTAYLQFRTNGAGTTEYRGWIAFLKKGLPVEEADIPQITLKNASGNPISISEKTFYYEAQFFGAWNGDTTGVDYSGPTHYSGFSIYFPEETSLPAGNYTYEATTSQGDILTTTVYFPGETPSPVVDSASMNYQWQLDDSLHLSWTAPTGDFDQLRVVLMDQDFRDVLYIRLPVDADAATVPGDVIQDISYFKNPISLNWVVQTRFYAATSDANHYARGYSNWINFAWQPHPVNNLGMGFVKIPAGTYTMGSPDGVSEYPVGSGETPLVEPGREDDETPHMVTLTRSFYMQTTEVTQKQWVDVVGSNPSSFTDCGDHCPVENVSWDDIQSFLSTLNSMGQGTYRLPTEAEWEYASRAGSTVAFANGGITATDCNEDPNLDDMGWYCFNSDDTPHRVAKKEANAYGLFDMHGNVSEFCQNWYGAYPADSVTDPTGPADGTVKIHRGGSWGSWVATCRSAHRYGRATSQRDQSTGFRLVREP